jgi:hypothetical protein
MTPTTHDQTEQAGPGVWARWTVWAAGLVVALGAGVATAHGLYEVALAAGTPRVLAWLYPLITDGLALVAYATTARLANHGRSYAWTVVVIAAGLSGLTQASYLAGGVASAPPALRFAIGAWPAIAAAIVAHLLYLLGSHHQPTHPPKGFPEAAVAPVPAAPAHPAPAHPAPALPAPQALPVPTPTPPPALTSPSPANGHAVLTMPDNPTPRAVQPDANHPASLYSTPVAEQPKAPTSVTGVRASAPVVTAPARVRAQTAATGHAARHGQLPTVSELMALAKSPEAPPQQHSKTSATSQRSSTPPSRRPNQGPTDEQTLRKNHLPTSKSDNQKIQPEITPEHFRTRDPLHTAANEVSTKEPEPRPK